MVGFKFFASLLVSSVFLTGCKFSFSTDFGSLRNLSPEMEASATAVMTDFYAGDFDALISKADVRVADSFTVDGLERIKKFSDNSSQPENKVKISHNFQTIQGIKAVVIVYEVPNEVGREKVTLTLAESDKNCCDLVGYHMNLQIGEQYMMDEFVEPTLAKEEETENED